MRLTNIVGSLFAVGLVVAAVATTSTSRAGDAPPPNVQCGGGNVTVTGTGGWKVNAAGPWKWDKGGDVIFAGCDAEKHCAAAKATGPKCEGQIKAYMCNGAACTSMTVAVK